MGKIFDFVCNEQIEGHGRNARKMPPCLDVKFLKALCVDEFDAIVAGRSRGATMMSTDEQIKIICDTVNEYTQRVFFSATLDIESLETSCNLMRNYVREIGEPFVFLLDPEDATLACIKQRYVVLGSYENKLEALIELVSKCRISQCIVFANTIDTVNKLKAVFDSQSISMPTSVFHGGMSGPEREAAHEEFKRGATRILIATDVLARGYDVIGVNMVINFDMPDKIETYIHRIGRSGRYQRKGKSISFIIQTANYDEMEKVHAINRISAECKLEELEPNIEEF